MRTLFTYQKNAIVHMAEIEDAKDVFTSQQSHTSVTLQSRCGILADPTGSGKTTTMLGFIQSRVGTTRQSESESVVTRRYGAFITERVTLQDPTPEICSGATLIIVSPNLVNQWAKEAEAVTGNVPLQITTSAHVLNFVENPDISDIVIVNELRYRLLCALSCAYGIRFARIVYDECKHLGCISRTCSTQLMVLFTWFIGASETDEPKSSDFFTSTTPMSMMSQLDQMPAAVLRTITVRTPAGEISYPGTVVHRQYKCRSLSDVTDIIADTMMDSDLRSRIMAGDIQGALTILGAEEASDIYTVVVYRLNRDLRHLRFLTEEIETDIAAGARLRANVASRLDDLKQKEIALQRQIETSESRFNALLQNGTCSICLDNFQDPAMVSCCSNVFCSQCLLEAQVVRQKCPLCRSTAFKIHRVAIDGNRTMPEPTPFERPLSKIAVLRSILSSATASKVLIYAEYEVCWPLVCEISKECGATPMRLQGHAHARCGVLSTFRESNDKVVLFASAILDCSGIDLPETTDIVIWHQMATFKSNQIVGRCRRVSTCSSAVCTVHMLYS